MNILPIDQSLSDWTGLFALVGVYAAIVVALVLAGRGRLGIDPKLWAIRISSGLERVTGIPGWAAAMVGTASWALLVAGMGFYNDVAWHVQLGRDEELFTAPHTAIVVGLFAIFASALIGGYFAMATKAGVGVRVRGFRIPRSALAMGLLGGCALLGFPLDELWHHQYGIDVTMWSPTHLLMIVGASLSPLASWLALGEAGVRPEDGRWAKGVHVAVGCLAILGLTSVQGEFAFGVPQFQQLYHPVLYALAGGFALTAVAVAVRRWWAPLVVAGVGVFIGAGDRFAGETGSEPRAASLYIVAAIGVAAVALVLGTERRSRFVIASGVVVGTLGLGGEWLWSQGGWQPWGPGLLPEAPVFALATALGAAALGGAFGAAVRGEAVRLSPRVLAAAGLVVVLALALPLPRRGSDVSARVEFEERGRSVVVEATLAPPDAARDARWFQAIAWQGGDFQRAEMVPTTEPGVYRSDRAVPAHGRWKTMLRLHRGAEMVAIPIWLPADPEIGAPEVPVTDRRARFEPEQQYLLREQRPGPPWASAGIYLGVGLIAVLWAAALALGARSLQRRPQDRVREIARV